MSFLQQYRIPFPGLKLGKHSFKYEINKHFFDEFEYSIVKGGLIQATLELNKEETLLILKFHISGSINLVCDACLADYDHKINIKEQKIVKFNYTDDQPIETDEIIVLGKNDHEIDVSLPIYEAINLAVPYSSRCTSVGNLSSCDQEMIQKLKSLSPNEQIQKTDSRWDILKKLKIDKN